MAKYYFQTSNPDLGAIAKRLVVWFKQNEYEVASVEDDAVWLIQAKKTGTFRTLTGTNIAFNVKLYFSDTPEEFVCETATGQWTANIAGAATTALFTGGITLVTGALGAAWTVKVERDIVEFMETTLKFRKMKTEGDSANAGAPSVPPPVSVPSKAKPIHADVEANPSLSPRQKAESQVAASQKKLEEALAAGILDSAEFGLKLKALQASMGELIVKATVEERSQKLKAALESGVISDEEFASKLDSLKAKVEEEVRESERNNERDSLVAKLRAAFEAGILTEEEFKKKLTALN
jgi:hypothetical protein